MKRWTLVVIACVCIELGIAAGLAWRRGYSHQWQNPTSPVSLTWQSGPVLSLERYASYFTLWVLEDVIGASSSSDLFFFGPDTGVLVAYMVVPGALTDPPAKVGRDIAFASSSHGLMLWNTRNLPEARPPYVVWEQEKPTDSGRRVFRLPSPSRQGSDPRLVYEPRFVLADGARARCVSFAARGGPYIEPMTVYWEIEAAAEDLVSSADGRLIAMREADATPRMARSASVFRAATGECVYTYGDPQPVDDELEVGYGPDGRVSEIAAIGDTLACILEDGAMTLLEFQDGEEIGSMKLPGRRPFMAAAVEGVFMVGLLPPEDSDAGTYTVVIAAIDPAKRKVLWSQTFPGTLNGEMRRGEVSQGMWNVAAGAHGVWIVRADEVLHVFPDGDVARRKNADGHLGCAGVAAIGHSLYCLDALGRVCRYDVAPRD